MNRSISIWYSQNGEDIDIEVHPHDLLGTQYMSQKFWSLQILKDLGIKELTLLGHMDPISFVGSEDLKVLESEIGMLEENQDIIEFDQMLKRRWIENLRYCYDRLLRETPAMAIAHFMIG